MLAFNCKIFRFLASFDVRKWIVISYCKMFWIFYLKFYLFLILPCLYLILTGQEDLGLATEKFENPEEGVGQQPELHAEEPATSSTGQKQHSFLDFKSGSKYSVLKILTERFKSN